jgi:hypothetical protein
MAAAACAEEREYGSGETVEPGYYVDLDTGAVVQVRETDELPEGSRTIQYRRRFRRVQAEALKSALRKHAHRPATR